MDRLSPKHAAQKRNPPIPDSGLPPIQQFSDVAWLFWTTLGGNNNNNRPIRYFMSITITNGETEAVIAKALNDNGLTLGPWPGHFFEWDTDEFKAILGTSNGQGFGYVHLSTRKPAWLSLSTSVMESHLLKAFNKHSVETCSPFSPRAFANTHGQVPPSGTQSAVGKPVHHPRPSLPRRHLAQGSLPDLLR